MSGGGGPIDLRLRRDVHFFRWRTLQTVLKADGFPVGQPEADLDRLEDQIIAAPRLAATPKFRRYELVKK